ncbi:ribosome biogenesis protein [Schizosaccharomyces cryophilus OY26]|uniref:Ribosome biogenesis protein SLX9 n=1 Tax=Schizosaccharomyces cryophilus (strain OY26 / ATCC MYA-4695 / CBS 11777 / NBRC 106824 / NRRL Y48691) TaxID=653667 RepID=S9WY49_SCHCR|nr:ribosome biogenesis protein [Schizosaccharomyces cryophilus OY26]EPY49657.1 ribosome biogenesis protein [Schizosaccharomyces cryophilus OY26]
MPKAKKRTSLAAKAANKLNKGDDGHKSEAAGSVRQEAREDVKDENLKVPRESKLDKRKERHDAWQQKFNTKTISSSARRRRNRKQRENLQVNMSTFENILPELETEIEESEKKQNPIIKDASITKRTKASMRNDTVNEIDRFQSILQHPSFMSNPLKTVQEHLSNSLPKKE